MAGSSIFFMVYGFGHLNYEMFRSLAFFLDKRRIGYINGKWPDRPGLGCQEIFAVVLRKKDLESIKINCIFC